MKKLIALSVMSLALAACNNQGFVGQYTEANIKGATPEASTEECENTSGTNASEFMGIVSGKVLAPKNEISSRVVMLSVRDGLNRMVCTASLLENNVVITAAHCFPEKVEPKDVQVIFTTNRNCLMKPNKLSRAVSKIVIPSQYRAASEAINYHYDIAMLRFEGEPVSGYTTFPLPGEIVDIKPQTKMIMTGYGEINFEAGGTGVLRITSQPGDNVIAKSLEDAVYGVQQKDSGICRGDSGGPLIVFKEGLPRVVGIASRVIQIRKKDQKEEVDKKKSCNDYSIYTATLFHKNWILETFAELSRP